MPKLKPLIYAFFFFYFVTYCNINKLTKESSYDSHNKIYTPNYNKNKYVDLPKNCASHILQTPREEINGKSTEVGSKQLC